MTYPPSRHEVRSRLAMLARGDCTPEAASLWAHPFLTGDRAENTRYDEATWRALTALGGADTKDADGGYLYQAEDHVRWQREYEEATGIR